MKKKLLLLFIVAFMHSICFSQKTFNATSGNWNVASNWTPIGVPTASDDVIIPSGKTVIVTSTVNAESLSISGTLTMNDGAMLTIGGNSSFGNLTVNTAGNFTMPNGSGNATLIVYGNYYNNGTTDFWKSNVIIVGDLLSPSSSALQNQGNVIVGGNIIGAFSLTGGTGTNQIYALNPNATVTITPTSIDNNVPSGTTVTTATEAQTLVDLVNSIIYGSSSCTFATNDPSNSTTCAGTNAAFTVSTSQSSPTYQWQVNTGTGWNNLVNGGVYSGVTASTLTLTNVNYSMNGYKYRAKITAGCSKNGNYGVLTVNAAPSIPTSSITQPTCSTSTGAIALTIQTATDTYSFDNGLTFQANNIKSSITAGSYNVIIKNVIGCNSIASACVVAQNSSIWNGSSWTPSAPISDDIIIFNGNYSSTGDLTGCSCTVNSGSVIINSGNSLTLTKGVVVSGGSLTFENTASLVQINDSSINSGNIIYKRKTTPLKQYDFTYWSSPVSNSTLNQLATNSAFYSFSSNTNNWVARTGTTNMTPGTGYIGRAPSNLTYSPTQIVETNFVGVPNNGIIITPIIKSTGSLNLIGNPYPSSIDADLFLTDAANINNINGTIYLWTHNTAITNNSYNTNDYAKYNLIGGVKTSSAALTGGIAPTGKIAAGQSFFIEANSSLSNGNYSVNFKNSMRSTNNSQFYKSTVLSNATVQPLEKHRVWVSISTNEGAYNETLIGYIQGATNDFDSLFDGKTVPVGNNVTLYSIIGVNNFAIQGRSIPFDNSDIVPIGYSSTTGGQVTINLENFDGLFENQNIYLYDKNTGLYHDLKTASYTFMTSTGTFNDRFEIRYTTTALSTNSISSNNNEIKIIASQHQFSATSNKVAISKIEIYDVLGKLLFIKNSVNSNEFSGELTNVHSQLLFIKVILENQQIITKKAIVN